MTAAKRRCPSRRRKVPVRWVLLVCWMLLLTPFRVSQTGVYVEAADDDYYGDDNAQAYNGDDANNNGDDGANDDANDGGNDDAGDDRNAQGDDVDEGDDDVFRWDNNNGFGQVSIMPVSCVNYNNGHMIRFDFFDSGDSNYQCHFNYIGSFVVSIAHYMRAFFNYQALTYGKDFQLPGDAGYLNCVMLQETGYSDQRLYAKIGCMERETYSSTKLQLHVYSDAQCSVPYDDGQTSRRHATKGYEINGYYFSTRVSFRPPFYACQACAPLAIAETFNKRNGNWYDDDYISEHGKKEGQNGNDDNDDYYGDDYFNDDAYMYANDDVARDDDARYGGGNDDGQNDDGNANKDDDANGNKDDDDGQNDDGQNDDGNKNNNRNNNGYNFDDDYYKDDDNRRQLGRSLVGKALIPKAASGELERYAEGFWQEVEEQKSRSLWDNYYDIANWNMCQRVYKYGVYCDENCRALDAFRVDEWSKSDVVLLVIMCMFMSAMMLLVVAKRLKAAQKARLYGDESYKPGVPPTVMGFVFVLVIVAIIVLAKLKLVNATLVFAVVTCILLFIYMLKLTLFESRRPVLLAAPRHDMFDNPLDDRLFD